MRYTAMIRRDNDTTFESKVDTTAGDTQAVELARTLADSYGATLVDMRDSDGKELNVGETSGGSGSAADATIKVDQNKDTEERIEEQDKTTTERVDAQTRDVRPNKTGDIKPDR